MYYPVQTEAQLRAILKALRKARGLTQEQVGQRLGVTQKRVARIEAAPESASMDQISRLVTVLGGRIVIEEQDAPNPAPEPTAEEGW